MRRSWLYEIPVFYLLLAGVERAFLPERPAFAGLEPHPFWLGVLLFSLRYGFWAGAFSGALAAALFLAESWAWGDRFRFEDADFYLQPGFFLALGFLLGGVLDRLRRRVAQSREETEHFKEKADSLFAELEAQKRAHRAVEQQVVSQMSTLVTLYEGARHLGTLERKALLKGILDFFCAALKAEKAAVHLLEKDRWTLFAERGWKEDDAYPRELAFQQGLIGRAGAEGRVVSLRDWFSAEPEKAWASRGRADAVMAGPLRRDTGEVVGVFSVQELPLLRFNSASVNLLTLLVDWAETSISKCLYFEELKSKLILDEVYNVYNASYFRSRCGQEFQRSKTYALPFSLLLVATDGIRALPLDRQVNALRALGRALQESSRDIDIVTKFPDPGTPFAVLMMTAPAARARELKEGILASCAKLGLDREERGGPIRVGVSSYEAAMASMEEMIARARADLG